MKFSLTILLTHLTFLTYGQKNNDTIQVIAKQIAPGQGDKIYIAKYKVIKVVKGKVTIDTIKVGYYFYNDYQKAPDTAFLNLMTYSGDTKFKDYYIFPNYNANKGIEKVKISFVEFNYWVDCETGTGKCKPVTITRETKDEKVFLFMPCCGAVTTVTLTKQVGIPKKIEVIQKCKVSQSDCPPTFELTNLKDGKYFANIFASGLLRQLEINLMTK